MPSPLGFFYDADGNKSFGRLAAGYLIVAAVFAFVAGFLLPLQAAYCAAAMTSFLTTAGAFYLASKGQQSVTSIFGRPLGMPPSGEPQQ